MMREKLILEKIEDKYLLDIEVLAKQGIIPYGIYIILKK